MSKLIRVEDSTYKELGEYGRWEDTMDAIVRRLMQQARSKQRRHEEV